MTPIFESNVMDFEQGRENDGDSKLVAMFYKATELNEVKSLEAGRPVHDEIDLIKIIVPGQRDSVVAKATYDYQRRFPKQWAQYQADAAGAQHGSGTPLGEASFLTMAQIADLKAMNVHTVEQLAGMADAQAHAFMGFHSLKQTAQAYIDAAAGRAPVLQMQAENDKLRAELNEMKALLEKVAEQQQRTAKTHKAKVNDLA